MFKYPRDNRKNKSIFLMSTTDKTLSETDGYATRYWAVYVDGELLAMVVYRKSERAIAEMLMRMR